LVDVFETYVRCIYNRETIYVVVLSVAWPPVLARHFRCSNDCVLLFDAVCKSEHAVHVTSESRMTGDWEGAGLKLLWLHPRTNPIFVYRNWRKPRKPRQFSRWRGKESKKRHIPIKVVYCCKNPSGGRRKPGYKTHLDA